MATIQYCDYDIKGKLDVADTSTFKKQLTVSSSVGGDSSWDDSGILIENTSTSTGEPTVAFRNAGSNGTGSNYWFTGLNQNTPYRIAYGASFTDGNTKLELSTSGLFRFNSYGAGTLVSDANGNITSTSTPPGTGTFLPLAGGTMTGDTLHNDNVKSVYGTSGDGLKIFHDGGDSFIRDLGTGNLLITSDGASVQINKGTTENMAEFIVDGAVKLYYDSGKKFETTAGGTLNTGTIDSTGTITVTGANGNVGINTDTGKLLLGASYDLQMYHNGTNSNIENFNGTLQIIQNLNDGDISFRSDNGSGGTAEYFRLDGGAAITVVSKDFKFSDNIKARFGTSDDLQIYHDGSNSYIDDASGNGSLYVNTNAFRLVSANKGENMIRAFEDGQVILSHNNVDKLATTSSGVTITGNIDLTPSSSDILMIDNSGAALEMKQGSDLYMRFITTNGGEHIEVNKNIELSGMTATSGTFSSTLTANNGSIILGGTGRIQGIDTVSVGTDATSKTYVDNAINTAITGVLRYDGTWNASTNSPTLSSGSGTVGEYYIVSVAGSTNLDGITDWAVGDWAVFSDQATDAWQKIDNTQVGNVTGSGSSGRVAFWNSDSNLTSDSDLTFNGSSLVVGGTVTAQTGNSVQWNSAYQDTITGFSDSGSSTTTLTLTQRDGGTLTTSFSNPQGTVTGSGQNLRLALWDGTSSIGSDADFTYDGDTIFTTNLEASGNLNVLGTLAVAGVSTFSDEIELDQTNNFINPSSDQNKNLKVGVAFGTQWSTISMAATTFSVTNGGFGAPAFSVNGNNIATAGDLTVSGGDITLGGTGRIQGVDTVSASTDAANKAYVDAHVSPAGTYLPLAGGTMTGDILMDGKAGVGNVIGLATGTSTNAMSLKLYTYNNIDPGGGLGIGTGNIIQADLGQNLVLRQTADDGDIIFQSDDGSGGITQYYRIDGGASLNVFSKDILLPDNVNSLYGSSSDLKIFHNGTNSHIQNTTGDLYVENLADDKDIIFRSDDGSGGFENYIQIDGSAGRTLFNKNIRVNDNVQVQVGSSADLTIEHNGSNTLITNNVGNVVFTQNANDAKISFNNDNGSGGVTEYFRLEGTEVRTGFLQKTIHYDNVQARFGDSGDLRIFHDGSNSFIQDTGTGDLYIDAATNFFVRNQGNGDVWIKATNAGVSLRYQDTQKLITTNTGVTVNGKGISDATVASDSSTTLATKGYVDVHGGGAGPFLPLAGGTMTGNTDFLDNVKLIFGNSDDLNIFHDSANTYLENKVGDLIVRQEADDKDIIFKCDNGSGGDEAYLTLDGSTRSILVTAPLGVYHNDGIASRFGDVGDLQIYHDGNDSYINETGTGILFIRASTSVRIQGVNGESMIDANENGDVNLYYDNSLKFQTTSTGVTCTAISLTDDQFQVKNQSGARYALAGDPDTGLGAFDGSGGVSLVCNNKKAITAADGDVIFDNYTATAVATTGSLNANQSNQAATQDTLAQLCVDPDGDVVRGSQEGTWTFTAAQINALTTSTTAGPILIAAPGANKAIIVEETNWMVKYSGTGSMATTQAYEVRQSIWTNTSASISRLPSTKINEIMNSAQGTPSNPSYGFYSRDVPDFNNDARTYNCNKPTRLNRLNTNALPGNLVSISIKLKYRLFNADTF